MHVRMYFYCSWIIYITSLLGGQTFTTLDLSHAHLLLELEEESQELVTIDTNNHFSE